MEFTEREKVILSTIEKELTQFRPRRIIAVVIAILCVVFLGVDVAWRGPRAAADDLPSIGFTALLCVFFWIVSWIEEGYTRLIQKLLAENNRLQQNQKA